MYSWVDCDKFAVVTYFGHTGEIFLQKKKRQLES